MKKLNLISFILVVFLGGCASIRYEPEIGMSYMDVNRLAWINCSHIQNKVKLKMSANNLQEIIGPHSTYSIKAYKTYADPSYSNSSLMKECQKIIYIKDEKVISESDAKEIKNQKIKLLREIIKDKNLMLVDFFKDKDESLFRIYEDADKRRFYSKGFEFVENHQVTDDLNSFNIESRQRQEAIDKFKREEFKRLQENAEKINRLERQIANQKKEDELKDILQKNNLQLIYRSNFFAVAKSNSRTGNIVYIKDGQLVNSTEVQSEIREFNRFVAAQKAQEESKRINLSQKWFVQAQGVGGYCQVTGVRESGRDSFTGGAVFSISYHCTSRIKPGYGGSSGSTSITCCNECANKITQTSVMAVCQ